MINFQLRVFVRLPIFKQCCRSLLLLLLISPALALQAQTDRGRVYGPLDSDVKMPKATGKFGQIDASASSEIASHRNAVGASSTWQGMSGTGQITYPGDSSPVVDDATFTILNIDNFRLDVTTANGIQSTRISGAYGAIKSADGTMRYFVPTSAKQGLVAYPLLLDAAFPRVGTSVFDMGMITVNGNPLHRITVERPLNPAMLPSASMPMREKLWQDVVTDYYFDPTTHLLHKSVDLIQIPGSKSKMLQCITYSDYQRVEGVLIPFNYRQTLNGHVQWILQLNQVQAYPSQQQSFFIFRNNSQ